MSKMNLNRLGFYILGAFTGGIILSLLSKVTGGKL